MAKMNLDNWMAWRGNASTAASLARAEGRVDVRGLILPEPLTTISTERLRDARLAFARAAVGSRDAEAVAMADGAAVDDVIRESGTVEDLRGRVALAIVAQPERKDALRRLERLEVRVREVGRARAVAESLTDVGEEG